MSGYFNQKRAEVEEHLRSLLRPQAGLPASLLEAMRYSLLAPGKRLRPLLVVLSAEACGGSSAKAMPAAAAVEMVHAYSLVHDDLPAMDDDDLRRGLPTCHKKFGEALAILAGDALLTMAFQVLGDGLPPATAGACCRELAKAAGAAGMVGGQVEDLSWELSGSPTLDRLEQLHLRKTGALIRASLRLGALTAYVPGEAPAPLLERLDRFGRCLGLAFQITDDLLDVQGDTEQTGKRVGKDAARGKLTYPGLLGIDESLTRARHLGEEARQCLAPLGGPAGPLIDLVGTVLDRDR